METFTATIRFKAGNREQAEQIYALMTEAFCNQSEITPVYGTLVRNTSVLASDPIKMETWLTPVESRISTF